MVWTCLKELIFRREPYTMTTLPPTCSTARQYRQLALIIPSKSNFRLHILSRDEKRCFFANVTEMTMWVLVSKTSSLFYAFMRKPFFRFDSFIFPPFSAALLIHPLVWNRWSTFIIPINDGELWLVKKP